MGDYFDPMNYRIDDLGMDIIRYIVDMFSEYLDSVLTERILGINIVPHPYLDTEQTKARIISTWNSYYTFFKEYECYPESPIDLIISAGYDSSYDCLLEPGMWFTLLNKELYKVATEVMDELGSIVPLVDASFPKIRTMAKGGEIIYASFSHGLIIFK